MAVKGRIVIDPALFVELVIKALSAHGPVVSNGVLHTRATYPAGPPAVDGKWIIAHVIHRVFDIGEGDAASHVKERAVKGQANATPYRAERIELGPQLIVGNWVVRGQNIQEGVNNFAYVDRALVAPSPGWRDHRFNQSPFFIRQITRIAQHATIVMSTIFRRPHRRLSQIRPPPLNHK